MKTFQEWLTSKLVEQKTCTCSCEGCQGGVCANCSCDSCSCEGCGCRT